MAYSAPAGNAVDFSFVAADEGYGPPTGDAVDFSFLEARNERFLLGHAWAVEAGATERALLEQAYAVSALGSENMLLGQKWITASLLNNLMYLGQRWLTPGVRVEPSSLTHAWAVDTSNYEQFSLGHSWGVTGALSEQLSLNHRWAVLTQVSERFLWDHNYRLTGVRIEPLTLLQRWLLNGTPSEQLSLNQKHAVSGIVTEQVLLQQAWLTGGLQSEFFSLDQRWTTLLWAMEYLYLDMSWALRHAVSNDLVIAYRDRIAQSLTLLHELADNRVVQAVDVDAGLITRVAGDCSMDSPLEANDRVASGLTVDFLMVDDSSIVISTTPTATIGGQTVLLSSAEVAFDEGQFAYTCQMSLFDPADYELFSPDAPFSVNLGGEIYEFIVDSVEAARNSPDRMISNSVSGIGPSAFYAEPRSQRVTKTWDAPVLASSVAEELFGAGVVAWEIIDWAIPAFRLAADEATPMSILQSIAEAAGALVVAEPNGDIRVRYEFPVSVTLYPFITPDHEYDDTQHNFSVQERLADFKIVDRIRIMDASPDGFKDTLEFTQEGFDATHGKLMVYPNPWREDVIVEHTSRADVSVNLVGIEEEAFEELVEIVGGEGSTAKPIYQIDSITWLYVNLGSVVYEQDMNTVRTTHPTLKETLVKINYRTRRIRYDAAAFLDADVQFVLRDATDVN